VLRGARKLWSRRSPAEAASDPLAALQEEVAQLKEQANTAAGVIASLAEQNARLVTAVEVLRVRTRMLLVACGVLGAALAGLAAWVLT
jgi:hypothetical protein